MFVTSADGGVVALVTLSGEKDCNDFEGYDLTGYLERMSDGTQQELTNEVRLARFINATDYMEFCDYCGPDNSLIGVVFGFVFAMAGVALLAYGFRMSTETPEEDEAESRSEGDGESK